MNAPRATQQRTVIGGRVFTTPLVLRVGLVQPGDRYWIRSVWSSGPMPSGDAAAAFASAPEVWGTRVVLELVDLVDKLILSHQVAIETVDRIAGLEAGVAVRSAHRGLHAEGVRRGVR